MVVNNPEGTSDPPDIYASSADKIIHEYSEHIETWAYST